jgi:diguanylate cyclase (GGDEF)-like protein
MSKLAKVIAGQLRWTLGFFAVCMVALSGVSLWGLSLSTSAADTLYRDKGRILQATANVSDGIRDSYEQTLVVLTTSEPVARKELALSLLDETISNVDVRLQDLRQLPTIDTAKERVLVKELSAAWGRFRRIVVPDVAFIGPDGADLLVQVERQFAPINETIAQLRIEEERDSAVDAHAAKAAGDLSVLLIVASALAALLAATFVMVRGARGFVARVVAGEAAQQEFAQTMQLASTEDDAYRVITRHLERTITKARAIVLNRNNSADRLEAMTEVTADWPLQHNLDGARPRSCAAIRTARTYRRGPNAEPLLTCAVCSDCPVRSICTPVTVGGEIIGAVLLERAAAFDPDDEARIEQSVSQAAPVLANLRNLAVAEIRAATDALTGLPNKRAVGYTLKRMVAQASRTVSPLAVLSLDLDHFKQINDQFGHPHGDEVLAAVGAVLRATIREADFAGRNGGEEFLVLLPTTDRDGARAIAKKISSAIREIYIHNVDRRITVSIGIAVLPDDAGDAENLERAADRALYMAKANGRDRIEVAPSPAVGQLT